MTINERIGGWFSRGRTEAHLQGSGLNIFPCPTRSNAPYPVTFRCKNNITRNTSTNEVIILSGLGRHLRLYLRSVIVVFTMNVPHCLMFVLQRLHFKVVIRNGASGNTYPFCWRPQIRTLILVVLRVDRFPLTAIYGPLTRDVDGLFASDFNEHYSAN